jgi:hypothetical protein
VAKLFFEREQSRIGTAWGLPFASRSHLSTLRQR